MMKQLTSPINSAWYSQKLPFNRFQQLLDGDNDTLEQLTNLLLSQQLPQQYREDSIKAFCKIVCSRLINMKLNEFLKIDEILNLILRLLINSKFINFHLKKLLTQPLRQFIDNVGLGVKSVKNILHTALNYDQQMTAFIIFQAIFSSKIDNLSKIQLIDQFSKQMIHLTNTTLKALNQISLKLHDESFQSIYKQKFLQLKYSMTVIIKFISIFNQINSSLNNSENSQYKKSVADKLVKNQQFGHLIINIIGFKNSVSQLNIICDNNYLNIGFQVNVCKQYAFKCYSQIVKMVDSQFNINDSQLEIFYSIPTIIIYAIFDLEKILKNYDIINKKSYIEGLVPQIYQFLTYTLKIKDIYETFYKVNPQTMISILLPYLNTSELEYQLFINEPNQYLSYMNIILKPEEQIFGKIAVIKFIRRLSLIVDGFFSYFFMVCTQTIINKLNISLNQSENNKLGNSLINHNLEGAWLGLSIFWDLYQQRKDLLLTIIQILQNIKLSNMNQIQQSHLFIFLKYNHKIINNSLIQSFISQGLQIDRQSDNQALYLSVCNFIEEIFTQKIQSIQIQDQDNNLQVSNIITFNRQIYDKIQTSNQLHFYQAINYIINNQNQITRIITNFPYFIQKLLKRFQKLIKTINYYQLIKIQILSIIKNIIIRGISPDCYTSIARVIFNYEVLQNINHKLYPALINIFGLIVRSNQIISLQNLQIFTSVIIKLQNPLQNQYWISCITYILQNITRINFTSQHRMQLYSILINGLSQNDLVICRANIVIQIFILNQVQQLQSEQFNDILQIIKNKIRQINHLKYQYKKFIFKPLTIVHLTNTYLFGMYKLTTNQINQVLGLCEYMLNMYDKYTINVLVQAMFIIIYKYNSYSQQLSQKLTPYIKLVVNVLQSFRKQQFCLNYRMNQQQNLLNLTAKETNYFNRTDCYSNFHKFINLLREKKLINITDKNMEHQINSLMMVEDVNGNIRTLYKIKQLI